MHIEFTFSPTEEDIASIYQGLLAFDAPHFPGIDVKNFGLFVRDADNQVVGGLSGDLLFTSLLIQYFWISEPCRAQGLGRTLIERAEREAKLTVS
ncbi:GNAT family N-acetyltransferase [Vibrio sp. PP-XX7]